jgi:tripeptide aminopeptidase
MVDALQDAAADTACDVDVVTEKQIAGYRLRPSSPPVVAAEAALRARGYEPRRIVTGGGSDVNALAAAGLPCVNLANGTERNHEPTERISVESLNAMLDVAFALLDESAAVLATASAPGATVPSVAAAPDLEPASGPGEPA